MTRNEWGLSPEWGPYRGGQVHVLADKCSTCIFRPGNPMRLPAGRRRAMVAEALGGGGAIICHSTLGSAVVAPAVCRGFWDRHGWKVVALRLAVALRVVVFDPVPPPLDGRRPGVTGDGGC